MGDRLRRRREGRPAGRRGSRAHLDREGRRRRASAYCASGARTTSGRWARRARAARAPRSTSTAAARTRIPPTARTRRSASTPATSASSSSGTTCSWSSTGSTTARSDRCPRSRVDTGMGFERILVGAAGQALELRHGSLHADLRAPLEDRGPALRRLEFAPGHRLPRRAPTTCARSRAALSDGALPSNTGRGYVLRRLDPPRRALRTPGARPRGAVPVRARAHGRRRARRHFPRAARAPGARARDRQGRGAVVRAHARPRAAALRGSRVEARRPEQAIPGAAAFELYATYGFPRDLVELMARERGLAVDSAGWDKAEKAHQDASRSEGKFKQLLSAEQLEGLTPTKSLAHEALELESRVLFIAAGDPSKLVLAESPFYAESGGQVGDPGTIADPAGRWRFVVEDTRKVGPVIVHLGQLEGVPPNAGDRALACVDSRARSRTQKNHTATHLLHRALKEVLGNHVGTGRQLRRPRSVALRLLAPEGRLARGARAHRGPRQRAHHREPSRPDHGRGPRGRQGARCRRHVRREVRRARARARRRRLVDRAVRRHARLGLGRHRPVRDHARARGRGRRAAHRGAHRSGRGRGDPAPAPAARAEPRGC